MMKGGALVGEQRKEYKELCSLMTSRKPDLDYRSIRDRLLDILREDVTAYIATLPEEDHADLLRVIDTIFLSINGEDPEYLSTINIVGFQVSLLFTQYEVSKPEHGEFVDTEELFTEIMEIDWANYDVMKKFLEDYPPGSVSQVDKLLSDHMSDGPIFMVFIGFLRISEILDSYFNNVFYLGLSYKSDMVDGSYYLPLSYLTHDLFHYDMFSDDCTKHNDKITELNAFRQFIKDKADRPTQYAIDFTIFFIVHEEPYCSVYDPPSNLKFNIYESVLEFLMGNIDALRDLNNFGKAIPPAYREVLRKKPTKLKIEKVIEYLQFVAITYIKQWAAFKSLHRGGRRRTIRRVKRRATRRRRQ